MFILGDECYLFVVPKVILPSRIEEEFKDLLSIFRHHRIKAIVFDFSSVQVLTSEGLQDLSKWFQFFHLLGLDCHVMAIPSHVAIPLVDFFSELPFLKFHRNLLEVLHSRVSLSRKGLYDDWEAFFERGSSNSEEKNDVLLAQLKNFRKIRNERMYDFFLDNEIAKNSHDENEQGNCQ